RLESGQAICRARVSAEPYEALRIDVDAVLALRPFIAIARPAPRLDVIACGIEHDHRWSSHGFLLWFECSRPVQDPNIVLCIDRNARGISELPLGRHLRPPAIHLEGR